MHALKCSFVRCCIGSIFLFFSTIRGELSAKRVLTLGGATEDVFIVYKDPGMMELNSSKGKESFLILKEGGKLDVKHIGYASGGGATNAAVSFRRLGFDAAIACKVGADKQGQAICDELEKEGVCTDYIVRDAARTTGMSFIVPTLAGDRTVFAYRGANSHVIKDDIPFDSFSKIDCLYVTSLGSSARFLLPEIVRCAKKHDVLVAVNPGSSQLKNGACHLKEALSCIDILLLNSEEAKLLMCSYAEESCADYSNSQTVSADYSTVEPRLLRSGYGGDHCCFDLQRFFSMLHAKGPRIIVVTDGGNGVYVAKDNSIYFHPGLSGPICNTLGAGDAFGSTFVASMMLGVSVYHAIRYAISNSLSVISHLDAKTGLLSLKELEAHTKKIDPMLVQKFPLS